MTKEFDSMDIELVEEAYNHLTEHSPANASAAASDLSEIIHRYGEDDVRPAGYSRVADAVDALKESEVKRAEEILNSVIREVTT